MMWKELGGGLKSRSRGGRRPHIQIHVPPISSEPPPSSSPVGYVESVVREGRKGKATQAAWGALRVHRRAGMLPLCPGNGAEEWHEASEVEWWKEQGGVTERTRRCKRRRHHEEWEAPRKVGGAFDASGRSVYIITELIFNIIGYLSYHDNDNIN